MNLRPIGVTALLLVLWSFSSAPEASGQDVRRQMQQETTESSAGDPATRSSSLDMQYHRAEVAWKSGASLLEAKARLDQVLDELPDDQAARTLRAQVLLDLDRPEEALADARRAVRLDSADGEARLVLSEAARLNGDRDLARRALKEAADHLTEDAMLHVRLSWNAALLDQPAQAEAYARIALAQDDALPAAYYQLARVFIQNGKADEAATVLARGLRASVVEPSVVRSDETLKEVSSHSALQPLLTDE